MKGFKATDKDGKCRDLKIIVGKTIEIKDKLELCKTGIHFCSNLMDVYNYYAKDSATRIFEVEALGEILTETDKSVTNKLKVIKELTQTELLQAWITKTNSGNGNSGNGNSGYGNSGNGNSGNRNSGDWNSGNRNSGYGNSGNRNSGDWNSGDGNSGYGNSGYGNSGNRNSGNGNSGYGNSGNRNSGDWNSGDGNSGYFNTKIPLYFFNKPSDMEYTDNLAQQLRGLSVKPILEWIGTSLMTEKEKANNKSHTITGGFLRKTARHDWRYLTDKDKEFIKSLPNFDDTIFQKISNGVSLLDEMIEVEHNGKKLKIDLKRAKELGLVKE